MIQFQILWTNIIRIVWFTVRRIINLIWELKGLIMISMFHSFFKVYRSREGSSHIWSHKKTERQWYGTTYKQTGTGICKKKLLLMQCWILCEIKTCIRLCNLDRVLLFLLSHTMILNCELVILRYHKVYRLSIFWCLDVFLWVSCS